MSVYRYKVFCWRLDDHGDVALAYDFTAFTAELPYSARRGKSQAQRRGMAMRWAWENGESMACAYLYSALGIEGFDFTGADFCEAFLEYADFRGCRLIDADFQDARLEYVDFRSACLRGADFRRAKMKGVKMDRSAFEEADLTDEQRAGIIVTDV